MTAATGAAFKMEASLMFDVLMYLNLFYFPVFLVCEGCVVFGKYISPNLWTPNIGKDAGVMAAMVTSEFIKLVIHRRFKDTRKLLANIFALIGTKISLTGILYVFIMEKPVLNIEYMICIIMFALLSTEVVFGILQYCRCCKRPQYV